MKTSYIIKAQDENEEVRNFGISYTTKREIESSFNRLMRSFAKDNRYIVERVNLGYARVTFFASCGYYMTEYWISRA